MAEETWDELWEDIDWDRVTTIPFITERIHKIKTEGDIINRKIEAVKTYLDDNYLSTTHLPPVIDIRKILEAESR